MRRSRPPPRNSSNGLACAERDPPSSPADGAVAFCVLANRSGVPILAGSATPSRGCCAPSTAIGRGTPRMLAVGLAARRQARCHRMARTGASASGLSPSLDPRFAGGSRRPSGFNGLPRPRAPTRTRDLRGDARGFAPEGRTVASTSRRRRRGSAGRRSPAPRTLAHGGTRRAMIRTEPGSRSRGSTARAGSGSYFLCLPGSAIAPSNVPGSTGERRGADVTLALPDRPAVRTWLLSRALDAALLLIAVCVSALTAHIAIDVIGDFALSHDAYDDVVHGSRTWVVLAATGVLSVVSCALIWSALDHALFDRVGSTRISPIRLVFVQRPIYAGIAVLFLSLAAVMGMECSDVILSGTKLDGFSQALGGSAWLGVSVTSFCALCAAPERCFFCRPLGVYLARAHKRGPPLIA